MHGSPCFRIASWLAPLLLIACTSDTVTPATTSSTATPTGTGATPPAPAVAATVAPQAAAAAVPGLAGSSWQLVRFEGGDGATLVPDDGSKYTLQFIADGSVAVRLDCNRGRGTWKEPEPGALDLGPMALTRAACPPGSLHDQIARQWTYIRSYLVRDGHLFLALMADGGIYEFAPVAAPTQASVAGSANSRAPGTESTATLVNTYWKLLTLGEASVASPPGTRELHLILQPGQQRVTGFSGCNRLTGGYQLDGERLNFSQMAGTMMACPPPAMELERSFHAMLGKVARWRINGEKLDLLDDSGAVLGGFESRYMQ